MRRRRRDNESSNGRRLDGGGTSGACYAAATRRIERAACITGPATQRQRTRRFSLGHIEPSAQPDSDGRFAAGRVQVPAGFSITLVAQVTGARELAALPNGDLLVGTTGSTLVLVPAAEAAGAAKPPVAFATLADDKAAGVTFAADGNVYAGTDHAVWRIGYTAGATVAGPIVRIARVRTGPVSPNADGDNHSTTSVVVSGTTLYAGVGSDCDACSEADPTRASIQQMGLDGSGMTTKARNARNVMALAVDPVTGWVWAGGAGQDKLVAGHPYETLDAISARPGVANYGWPACYDDRIPVAGTAPSTCADMTVPAIALPAYATLIGAAFYSAAVGGLYAFPLAYRGGMFASMHGSWHTLAGGTSAVTPQVVYIPFAAGQPASAVNWNDPNTQWRPFFSGFGTTGNNRIGRPTGVAVGVQGSLFVADDLAGNIYRIRPAASTPASLKRQLLHARS